MFQVQVQRPWGWQAGRVGGTGNAAGDQGSEGLGRTRGEGVWVYSKGDGKPLGFSRQKVAWLET